MFGLWAGIGVVRAADAELLAALREGGTVVLIRHAATEPGLGDPPQFRLDECDTQRNLSAAGRADAQRLGEALRAAGVPLGEVRSSRWCRCLDTARLAFGDVVEAWPVLDSFFGNPAEAAPRRAQMQAAMRGLPAQANWVWVTHQVNISALSGLFAAAGEMIVVRPSADGVAVVGRWRP